MFCSRCGRRKAAEDAKYCSDCGCLLPNLPSSSCSQATGQQESQQTIGFDEFRKRKETERTSRFEPKAKKSKAKTKKQVSEVPINIGFMKLEPQGSLKRCRGKTLPVKVLPTAGVQAILEKGVKKHSNHDKKVCEEFEYVLLYPDCSEVINLPGANDPFVLEKYREDVGKAYQRITLFIAKKTDYLLAELPLLEDSENDFDDEELDVVREQSNVSTSVGNPVIIDDESSPRSTSMTPPVQNTNFQANPQHTTARMVECPTCFQLFSIECIADHADLCVDDWVGEVDSPSEHVEHSTAPEGRELSPTDDVTLEDVLLKLVNENINTNEEARTLRVRRKSLWEDFKTAKRKCKLSPSDQVRIIFLGEPAIDDGGPKREFFSEMLQCIQRKLFISGKPISSTVCIQQNEFLLAGEIMVFSILHGGPAPSFFHPSVFRFLAHLPLLLADCESSQYKTAALKIQEAHDDKAVQEILMSDEVLDVLQDIGYSGIPQRETKVTSKEIVQSLCIKCLISDILPQIMQIEHGLDNCGLLTAIRSNPALFEPVFTPGSHQTRITSDKFLNDLEVEFSSSQLLKIKEIDVYKYFCDFLETLGQDEGDISISDIVQWMSGTDSTPVLGFPKKFTLAFVHGCIDRCQCRPTASTCDIKIKIPVHIGSEEEMRTMMVSAIKDCYGFGLV